MAQALATCQWQVHQWGNEVPRRCHMRNVTRAYFASCVASNNHERLYSAHCSSQGHIDKQRRALLRPNKRQPPARANSSQRPGDINKRRNLKPPVAAEPADAPSQDQTPQVPTRWLQSPCKTDTYCHRERPLDMKSCSKSHCRPSVSSQKRQPGSVLQQLQAARLPFAALWK